MELSFTFCADMYDLLFIHRIYQSDRSDASQILWGGLERGDGMIGKILLPCSIGFFTHLIKYLPIIPFSTVP